MLEKTRSIYSLLAQVTAVFPESSSWRVCGSAEMQLNSKIEQQVLRLLRKHSKGAEENKRKGQFAGRRDEYTKNVSTELCF